MSDDLQKIQKWAELLAAIERKDRPTARNVLIAFREALNLSVEEFAEKAHVSVRTVRRWEGMKDKASMPTPAKVRRWRSYFGLEPVSAQQNPHLDVKDRGIGGIFPLKSVLHRVAQARVIWALKSRMRFLAAVSPEAQEFLLAGFKRAEGDKLEVNCVWINEQSLQDQGNLSDVRPPKVAKESFEELIEYARGKVDDVDRRIRGFQVPLGDAARVGLANGPISMLVILYDSKAASIYMRKLDLFFELTSECYDATRQKLISHEEESVWFQVHPRVASCYWSEVWKGFESLEPFRYRPSR